MELVSYSNIRDFNLSIPSRKLLFEPNVFFCHCLMESWLSRRFNLLLYSIVPMSDLVICLLYPVVFVGLDIVSLGCTPQVSCVACWSKWHTPWGFYYLYSGVILLEGTKNKNLMECL